MAFVAMSKMKRAQLLSTAAALAVAPRIVRAQALEKLQITGVVTDDMTSIYYAIQHGLYQKAGLDVEVIPASSGTNATQAVVSGAYPVGKGSLIAALIAHVKGLPLTIIGNGVLWEAKNPFTLSLVAADSPIKTAADLNGKLCSSAALNDLSYLAVEAWVDKNGGDSTTLKWVEIPNSVEGAAVAEHRVDLCSLNEPQLSAAIASGKCRVFAPCYNAIATTFVGTIFFAQPDWAAKHADTIKRWTRVTYDTAAYTNAHHAETAAMMADLTKIPLDVISKMTRVNAATSGDPRLIQAAIDTAFKYKNLSRAFPAKEAYFSG
jgi:NitT/TauT family transport system substrate-binding protein